MRIKLLQTSCTFEDVIAHGEVRVLIVAYRYISFTYRCIPPAARLATPDSYVPPHAVSYRYTQARILLLDWLRLVHFDRLLAFRDALEQYQQLELVRICLAMH